MSPDNQTCILDFSNQLGSYFDATGHPRLAGRVLGYLLACEPPALTARDLADHLSVSRSAICPITRALVRQGILERHKTRGAREARYVVNTNGWLEMHRQAVQGLATMRRSTERALEGLANRPPSENLRLRLFRDFHAFLEQELPPLLERWQWEWEGKEP